MRRIAYLLLTVQIAACASQLWAEEDLSRQPISSPLQAVQQAELTHGATRGKAPSLEAMQALLSVLGIEDLNKTDVTVVAAPDIIAHAEDIPFVGRQLVGRQLTCLQFRWSDHFLRPSNDALSDTNQTAQMIVDLERNQVIAATISRESLDTAVDLDISVTDAEKQLRGVGEEYLGIPDRLPHTSLAQALQASSVDPLVARRIEAVYVLYQRQRAAARPSWIITLRGIPPIQFHGEGADQVAVYHMNHIRVVIDDDTGKLIMDSTFPQPPFKPDDPFKKWIDQAVREGKI